VLGLVGPAGAGKSTVARALERDGARVLDADRIGREIAERDPEVRAALSAEYGAAVYRADGSLDRGAVAARVFTDPAALARLNRLVHPRIVARLREGIAAAAREGFDGTLVVDAALLLDWGFERECDAVLAVIAPEALQVERLVAARGWTEEQARQRLANARDAEGFRAPADAVVVNDGSEAAAVAAARAVVAELAERRRGSAR
jgi:dephospho-CoA kinase